MTTFRRAFLAAFKSFLRGRSFLQALFAFWVRPNTFNEQNLRGDGGSTSPSMEDFLKEAEERLLGPIGGDELWRFSKDLKLQFRDRLQVAGENMLPSFNHLLPTGKETGRFVALDVGGSTLRVALVLLRGRDAAEGPVEIVQIDSFKITGEIKQLEGMAFFDWMASKVREVISRNGQMSQRTLPMGLAWSFPVEQTSFGGGLLMGMGKGFLATNGLMGQDLGGIIQFACKKQGIDVELGAIVNDGSATLLSQAYVHDSTRFGLILGTGSNAAVHLPVSALSRSKYGERPSSWFSSASHVIVNTEMSMFGKEILPLTRWDELLNAAHPRPDFQPLEHLLSGLYLGEICRLAIVEAVEITGLFGGLLPSSLEKPYSLETETLSRIEADTSPNLEIGISYFAARHPSTIQPTVADVTFIRDLASLVTRRSAALLAASVFSLWELRHETESEYMQSIIPDGMETGSAREAEVDTPLPCTKVAFNGSVIEHYPQYRSNCQHFLDGLVARSEHPGSVDLVPAIESSLIGAAVALASAVEENASLKG
jgi:hexokinase